MSNSSRLEKKKTIKQSFRVFFCFWRIFKTWAPEPPEPIKQLFEQYSNNGCMSIDQLQKLLIEVQGEKDVSKDYTYDIYNSLLLHHNIFHRRGLHIEAFFRYLLSDRNTALPSLGEVHQDMTAPLAHYFIFTGHNSYLTGNQLNSASSVDPIITALHRGVKVIELDLWPNSKKDDVEVRHGGTLTAPVKLIECLRAIKDHAFTTSESEYPVVITFEDHLTPVLQAKVAKMVSETFGAMLYFPESEHLKELPSPESLKRRIMISTKPPEYMDEKESARNHNRDVTDDEILVTEKKEYSNGKLESIDKVDSDDEEEEHVPEYEKLIAIHAGKVKDGLDKALHDLSKARRLSLSEQELKEAVRTHRSEIIRFTQQNLLRIYPKGSRWDSSNYDPMLGWMHGAQMVAFNMQTQGKYLRIMEGMFRGNGGCGYVKKPDFLLDNVDSDGRLLLYPNQQFKATLKVSVYMGEGWNLEFHHRYFDLCSPPDFFARVGIAGVPEDTVMEETSPIEDQWIPVWNKGFEFPLSVPELALLRVEVREYDTSKPDDFAGQTCLPVRELKTGVRAVPLHDEKGEQYKFIRLLMKFDYIVKEY